MDNIVKSYISYNSPLKEKNGKIAFTLLLMLLVGLAVKGWIAFGKDGIFLTMWEWVPYAIIGSILAYLVITFIDRKRGIGFFHLVTILSVLLITAPVASVINNIDSPFKLYVVGFNEEFFKILPLLIFVIFIPNLIRTKKDGMVYGALAGIGFNIIEIASYIATMTKDQPLMDVLYQQSTRFALWGFGSHVIWSAFVGLGIGIAMQSNEKGWKKWRLPIAIYLITAIAHSSFDLCMVGVFMLVTAYLLGFLKGEAVTSDMILTAGTSDNIVRDAMKIEHFVYNIVFIIIMIWQMIKTLKWEQALTVRELLKEGNDVVSESDKKLVENEGVLSMRKYKQYPKKTARKIVKYENLLAMLKHSVVRDGKDIEDSEEVQVLRNEIKVLKLNQ
ncbi:MAG: PrsW family intramembrane metalloprotease [Methanosarcinales archaeon]|nr:PrsW family intramembrane metalloprotease [Methanosarcinales archaeon]